MVVRKILPFLLIGILGLFAPAVSTGQTPATATAHFCRGLVFAEAFRHDDAIAVFTQAIRVNPRYAEAYFYRGNSYYMRGDKVNPVSRDFQGAIANWTQAINLGYPRSDVLFFNRGNTRGRLGDYRGAIADLTQAIQRNRYPSPGYYESRALAYYYLRNRSGAIDDLQQAANLYLQGGMKDEYLKTIDLIAAIKKGANPTALAPYRIFWTITIGISDNQTNC